MNTVESDWSHPGERLSSDQCCDCGSEKQVLKWIMREKKKVSKTWHPGGPGPGSQRVGAN